MYLSSLRKQNHQLVSATLALHANGELLPDSYVIDVEQFKANAIAIKKSADQYGIKLFGMTKQFGRVPYLANMLIELGYAGIVAVDFKEARILKKSGIKVSHIGHLVQPPESMIKEIVKDYKPDVITVYSIDKACSISEAALQVGRVQRVLVKFFDEDDLLYVNQESGFPLSKMDSVMQSLSQLKGIKLEGITHFPCFLYDGVKMAPTQNLTTLLKVKSRWPKAMTLGQVNMPSATCCQTLPTIAQYGGTHAEPGHALTGTFPANVDGSQPEQLAMLYLSEISHQFGDNSYCFAGGYYRRGNLKQCLIDGGVFNVSNEDESSIDYHLKVTGKHSVGSAVIMAFRTQVFVTRSDVVLLDGVHSGLPKVIGRYTALGESI